MAFINILYNLWPNGDEHVPGLRDGIAASAEAVFTKYGINSPLLVAHVMAQISHECGAGHDVVENLNYTEKRLPQVWPNHFNQSNAHLYAHNPQKLANFIYEPPIHNDLGNRPNSDDGWNFRGRGGSQTTGRAGYERVAKQTGLDVVNNPDLLIDPSHFLECAVSDFINCGCLPFAKKDDVVGVTKKLNGGTVGLSEREVWLSKWKSALGNELDFSLPSTTAPQPSVPVPSPVSIPPEKPPVFAPSNNSIWEFIASIFRAIFKRNT